MTDANRSGDQAGVECVPGVLVEEVRIEGKQAGIQDLEDAGQVDFGVFGEGVVAVDEERSRGERQQDEPGFDLQIRAPKTRSAAVRVLCMSIAVLRNLSTSL